MESSTTRNVTFGKFHNSTITTTSIRSHSIEDYVEYQIGMALWKYMSPVIIVLGVIGNILSFLVTTFTSMKQANMSIYLSALAVSDTGALIIGLGHPWLSVLFNFDIRKTHEWACKIHVFFTYLFIDLSAWMLVSVTIDRVIFVYLPLRARSICTRRNAIIVINLVVLIIIGINCNLLFTIGYRGNSRCFIVEGFEGFHISYWPWIDASVSSLAPFSILIVCNMLIIIQLLRVRNNRRKKLNVSNSNKDDKTRSMTIMLVMISVLFLCFTAPVSFDIIIKLSKRANTVERAPTTLAEQARSVLSQAIVHMLMYLNSALNFVMYCLSGKKFRDSLKKLLCRKKTIYGGCMRLSLSRDATISQTNVSIIPHSNQANSENWKAELNSSNYSLADVSAVDEVTK
ncbi:unnamed protein product [Owenia fusiformis]|uniref:G-protein coupled receptors family 1 profile domain-containing protein n=1 Tax=Owenia fusiformis TaxID=6347 RepID=A0A8S4Q3V9_OWEFU|nr:unnamed protein product [Owenia fusiformis]